jgi:hypothetical protein
VDLCLHGVKVVEDAVDGVVAERKAQRCLLGVEGSKDGRGGLAGSPGWMPSKPLMIRRLAPTVWSSVV